MSYLEPETPVHILVVDDQEVNVNLLSAMLERREFQVSVAYDGLSALEIAGQIAPDLVLLDINMPDMDGYEVCERLKADPRTADVPVIFISALGETENILRGFEVGAVDYILKPFKMAEVIARVETHLLILFQRRQLEAARIRDQQRFEFIDNMRAQFIASATHDLKNPLAVIRGYSTLLELDKSIQLSESATGYVDMIRIGVTRMMTLITDMLDLLQFETNLRLELDHVSLLRLLEVVAGDFQHLANEKQLSLSLEAPYGDVELYVDAARMRSVLDNLVSNAIKYTRNGGSVIIRGGPVGDEAIIEVQDTGLGIPLEARENLFKAFYRVKDPAHLEIAEGTGLGLSAVKVLVEQHGGTVELDSEVGQGSTFRVRLPLH